MHSVFSSWVGTSWAARTAAAPSAQCLQPFVAVATRTDPSSTVPSGGRYSTVSNGAASFLGNSHNSGPPAIG